MEDLRRAVINDYAKLCFNDGYTLPDEITLEDYKIQVAGMSRDELIEETWVVDKTSEEELQHYIDAFLKQDQYATMTYKVLPDGGSELVIWIG